MNEALFAAPWITAIARVFAQSDTPLYAVGGIVRNALMDLPASDVDMCGPARPETVVRLCAGSPVRAVLRASHFGTVELHVADEQGRHMAEYTTFREDSYRSGHKPVAVRFTDTLEIDALRRDFSVNALYRPLSADLSAHSKIIDPTGGLAHLKQGVLHTVTPDPDRVLKDDGLRILRAARFQAELGLRPTEALLLSAAKYAPLLKDIARERIRDELTRLLLADSRYPTLKRSTAPVPAGLTTVAAVGAWPYVFARLRPYERAVAALGTYAPPEGLPAVAGKLALLFCREDPGALASLMQSLRFSARETASAQAAQTALRRILADDCPLPDAVRLGIIPVKHTEAALTALQTAGEPVNAALARTRKLLAALQNEWLPLSLKALAVNGNDLLPLCRKAGVGNARIGGLLDSLWMDVVNGVLPNSREALLASAERKLNTSEK